MPIIRARRGRGRIVGMTESLLETGRLADTSEPAKTVDPTQHPVAWVRSTFYGLAALTVVVRCPLCYRDHSHEWQYESGDQDPGERPAPCGRSEYLVRLRRAPQSSTADPGVHRPVPKLTVGPD